MEKISEKVIKEMRGAGIPEKKIQEIVASGDEKAAKQGIALLKMIKEREKGPFVSLEQAKEELNISE